MSIKKTFRQLQQCIKNRIKSLPCIIHVLFPGVLKTILIWVILKLQLNCKPVLVIYFCRKFWPRYCYLQNFKKTVNHYWRTITSLLGTESITAILVFKLIRKASIVSSWLSKPSGIKCLSWNNIKQLMLLNANSIKHILCELNNAKITKIFKSTKPHRTNCTSLEVARTICFSLCREFKQGAFNLI